MRDRFKDSPLPDGWQQRYFQAADLDASYRELEEGRHFYIEAMRGRLRTLQLRFDEAWEHFDRGSRLVKEAEGSVPNLVRQFLLEIFRFECALIESPVDPTTEVPDYSIPDLDERILVEYPEVRFVLKHRRVAEALLRLHMGQCEAAVEMFEGLIADHAQSTSAQMAYNYISLAACQRSLGAHDEALRSIENAAFAAQTIDQSLFAGMVSARLVSVYRYLENRESAKDWEGYLLRLDCPQATKEVLLETATRLTERCMRHSRLVIF